MPTEVPQPGLSADEFTSVVSAVTNAFGDPTRREIYLFTRDSGADGVTAGAVAEHFELHPNVARHHLEKLAGGGYLTVEIARPPDVGSTRAAGRPSKRYLTGPLDATLALPLKHDDLLGGLLVRALDALGPEAAEALADEVGFEYGSTLAQRMDPTAGHRSVRAALTAVADALTAHGFASHTEARDGRLAIVSECCPFGETAQQYPHVVCALDRGMIRGMLAGLYGETSPQFETSRPDGGDHCVARASDPCGMARAYLDHASSSPLRPAALAAMLPYLRDHPGDPGRLHAEGLTTRVAIEEARELVAHHFGARPREVVFTASGTEAINTAIWGVLTRAEPGHVVTTAVEHSAVLEAVRRGAAEVTEVAVDRHGRFDPDEVAAAIRPDTVLVSVQVANHEVGTVQPAVAAVASARERGVLVHVDACAAAGHIDVDFAALGADLCSITGHKLGGPKGAAALLVRRGLRLPSLLVGGAQERARRGGIEDVAAIVGFAAAVQALDPAEAKLARERTDRLTRESVASVPGVERLGDAVDALPHLVCLAIEGVEAEPILLGLDQRGIAVHSGSSCSSEALEPSPVLAAMGVDADRSLRVSVGWSSTDADVDAFLAAFPDVVGRLRDLRR